jgi:type II restriction/modification system DNA methylase subunit YeeA
LVQTNETVDITKLKLCNEFNLVVPNWNSREEEEEDVSKKRAHLTRKYRTNKRG